jgi:hypothetical protein
MLLVLLWAFPEKCLPINVFAMKREVTQKFTGSFQTARVEEKIRASYDSRSSHACTDRNSLCYNSLREWGQLLLIVSETPDSKNRQTISLHYEKASGDVVQLVRTLPCHGMS